MSENDFNFELDLLIPWDIPLDYQPDPIQKQKLAKSLTLILESLQLNSIDEALIKTKQALENLGLVKTFPIDIKNTKTFLKNWEVKDYDNYFRINRVRATEPAACLVQSLLVNYQAFLILCQNNQELSQSQINIQKQGFISYARLLARNFQLDI